MKIGTVLFFFYVVKKLRGLMSASSGSVNNLSLADLSLSLQEPIPTLETRINEVMQFIYCRPALFLSEANHKRHGR